MIDRTDRLWFKDAIFYQLHPKTFFDSNADGFGDFPGVTEKLDYIQQLGVTAIWIMPFYPSPLRDGGYDISDYYNIDPTYGTLEQFQALLDAAHERGIRIVTELVINHTSDQHPWFQRARAAPPGSSEREFYVWSDTTEKFKDARIIFLDTETSNWAWDPVANAYYWHRFYSHQPDLNYDHPELMEAILDIMRFWLDMGVDGLRLDAIPYLIEREGTNCENLPETHAIIKRVRAVMEAEYPDRMLLAEANQWPEDTAIYFGDGDEGHMAFHFPLMPRMYMALAQEDRHPISDIMRQTPDIPDNCQWGIFLRNHDELTLEMVTNRDRDYLWSFYAADHRMRSNLGIRRRLAPLLDNDRRRIEFMVLLLLSFPGTPFLYYGDEIGMGDNIYLGDRDGVRTPMQWSPDRNGGFSRAHPGKLFLPVNQDPVYGSDVINVEAQLASPFSLLNWTRRMVMLRRQNQAVFARGTLRFLYPRNRKVLAYLRELDGQTILCVANVSRSPQAVELDMAQFDGHTPVEMTGDTAFPAIGALPYLLTLPAYGAFWFRLTVQEQEQAAAPPAAELFTLVQGATPESLLTGRELRFLEQQALPRFLATRAWFPHSQAEIAGVRLRAAVPLPTESGQPLGFAMLDVSLHGGETGLCALPVALLPDETEDMLPDAIARVRKFNRVGLLIDGAAAPDFAATLVAAAKSGWSGQLADGATLRFTDIEELAEQLALPTIEEGDASARLDGERASAISFGEHLVIRLYRQPAPGACPEIEAARRLWANGYRNAPKSVGALTLSGEAGDCVIAGLFAYVRNQGSAQVAVAEALHRDLEAAALAPEEAQPGPEALLGSAARFAQVIGQRLAELHAALGAPQPFGTSEFEAFRATLLRDIEANFALLRRLHTRAAARVWAQRERVLAHVRDAKPALNGLYQGLGHGNLTLAGALIVKDDVVLTGAGATGLHQQPMLADLASLMHSASSVVGEVVDGLGGRYREAGGRLRELAQSWLAQFRTGVFAGYAEAGGEAVADGALFHLLLLAHAVADLRDMAMHHPARLGWLDRHLHALLDHATT